MLFVLALALGGRGGQRPRQARLLAARLATERVPMTEELTALLNDRSALLNNYASLLLVLAIIAVMVFKP